MSVLKVVMSDLPDNPMYILPTMRELQGAVETMLDGHPVFDDLMADMSESVIITISVETMTETEYDALGMWEA